MTRRLPSLNALRTFAVVGRHASFSSAAAELHVTPGAVSRQIGLLEQELGLALFDRMRAEMRLTSRGREYHRVVGAALDSIMRATEQVAARADRQQVTVNVLPTLAMRWLIPRLARFNALHPAIRVEIVSGDGMPPDTTTWDLAIRYGRGDWSGLAAEMLFAEQMGVVCAPSIGVRVDTLDALPVEALLNQLTCADAWEQLFAQHGFPVPSLDGAAAFEHLFMVLEAARLGQGIALVPLFLVEQELRDGTLLQACLQTLRPRDSYYPLRRRDGLSNSTSVLRSWLIEEARVTNVGAGR
ncbi:MAG: LysR substrate-binding domain-containing protein [Janthinobacterium lividum]